MKSWWFFGGVKFVLLAAAGILAFGYVLMMLWNYLVPMLFAGPAVTFWQALGLLVLARLLFGFPGWRGRWGHGHWRRRFESRLTKMSPEERKEFYERCCGYYMPESEVKVEQSAK